MDEIPASSLTIPGKLQNRSVLPAWWTRYPSRCDWPLLYFMLLIATFFRFRGLDHAGLWLDEIILAHRAQNSVLELMSEPTKSLHHPAMSILPFSLFLEVGLSNYFIRFPSVFFGILSIPVIYKLGRNLFSNSVGLISALLLSISSFHIIYSQEARSYSMFLFFCLTSFYFFQRGLMTRKVQPWLLYFICTLAGIASHYLMILAVLGQVVLMGLVGLGIYLKGDTAARKSWLWQAVHFFSLLAVIGLTQLVWLNNLTTGLANTEGGAAKLNLTLIPSLLSEMLTGGSFTQAIFLFLAWAGGVVAWRINFRNGLLLINWAVFAILSTIISLFIVGQQFHIRHLIWALPPLLIAAGGGAVSMSAGVYNILRSKLEGDQSRIPYALISLGVTGLLLFPTIGSNLIHIRSNTLIKQSWPLGRLQEAVALVTSQAQSDDLVFAVGLPAQFVKFFADPTRQDLIYIDEDFFNQSDHPLGLLPHKVSGRWYLFRNSHYYPNVPVQWLRHLDYQGFNDVLVVHLPNDCTLPDCIQETKTLLQEISEANPDSTLATRASNVVLGFEVLQIQ
ncbi:MAG TPA: glycosyltransferase family 39 protein [Anaerolineae bacterium]|nr:glycosyltransferase family 39 protein [Anaerolineae bacterium]